MGMEPNRQIWTWFEGKWEPGNIKILGSSDHGTWLGTMVFDGARAFDGVAPDLDRHCARANHSAVAMGLRPTIETGQMVDLAWEGIAKFNSSTPLYIRPMYWSLEGGDLAIDAKPDSTAFALVIEEAAMGTGEGFSITTTRFTRPTLANARNSSRALAFQANMP